MASKGFVATMIIVPILAVAGGGTYLYMSHQGQQHDKKLTALTSETSKLSSKLKSTKQSDSDSSKSTAKKSTSSASSESDSSEISSSAVESESDSSEISSSVAVSKSSEDSDTEQATNGDDSKWAPLGVEPKGNDTGIVTLVREAMSLGGYSSNEEPYWDSADSSYAVDITDDDGDTTGTVHVNQYGGRYEDSDGGDVDTWTY